MISAGKYKILILSAGISSLLVTTGCIPPGGFGRHHGGHGKVKVAAPVLEPAPPPWAPAHGRRAKRMYHYDYYPGAQVYFDTGRGLYFYMEGGGWLTAPRLPAYININIKNRVNLDFDADRPYIYHHETMKKYPPGQMKNKHKKNKHKKNKHGKGRWK